MSRPTANTICLCMIVKNEEPVIRRCLRSLLSLLTYWVIVDTGSTDGTQEAVRDFMRESGCPGELIERPWVGFAHNRTEAFRFAAPHADYLLVIDADEYLEMDPGFVLPALTADVYNFELISGPQTYPKMQLFRAEAGWVYAGELHEYAILPRPFTKAILPGVRTHRIMDGARARDPMTYRRDALLLEEVLLKRPDDARVMYYLGQSYADAREYDLAIDRYSRRVTMGGWDEELWASKYAVAKLRNVRQEPWPVVQQAFLDAFSLRPRRAEPLFHIGAYYQAKQDFVLSHLFFARAVEIPFPEGELLPLEHEVYRFLLPLEYAVSCFYMGQHEAAIRTANGMLAKPGLTPERADQVIRNRQFSLDALFPLRPQPERPNADSRAVLVAVLCERDDPGADASLRSLQQQKGATRAIFLERTPETQSALRTRLEGTPFSYASLQPDASFAACLKAAAEEARAGEIVLPILGGDTFPDRRCTADLLRLFNLSGCAAVYGQYRQADGKLGNAQPLVAADELAAGQLEDATFALAFERELLEAVSSPDLETPAALLRHAGFAHIRFTDRPLVQLGERS